MNGRFIFLFELDSVITKKRILSEISGSIVKDKRNTVGEKYIDNGEIPFKHSFLQKADYLTKMPVSYVQKKMTNIELNDKVVEFIQKNKSRCYVITDYPDVWIDGLIKHIGIETHLYCSKAIVKDDYIEGALMILNRNQIIKQIQKPFVAVGNDDVDAEMIELSTVGIGFGKHDNVASSVLECATHAIYDENRMVGFLERLV